MRKLKCGLNRIISRFKMNSQGSTLVEMIVVFALLSIFMVAASTIVANIISTYYHVKGETYARQVSDIVMEKAVSEIEGAKYSDGAETDIPVFGGDKSLYFGDTLSLYDRTDTHITMSSKERSVGSEYKELYVDYSRITYTADDLEDLSREATSWKFDTNVYNGYGITELVFARADKLGTICDTFDYNNKDPENYHYYMDKVADGTYPSNVVAVFMTLKSPKYGEYRSVKFVTMYNFPADWSDSLSPGL